jgi:enoyl-CoA hydratase/carnithine racemase
MTGSELTHTRCEMHERIAVLCLNRPDKRNAISDGLLADLETFFADPPAGAAAVVIHGAGDHFCAGLDLAEHQERDAHQVMLHSQRWHRAFERIQFGDLPVLAALHGGVIGGGLELATAAHVRVAEPSTFYSLPEGRRGIFVGGGASVRVARIVGPDRMCEMMLTGRQYAAEEGQRLGLSHYLVGPGEALAKAKALAASIIRNAPLSNYMMLNAIARIHDMSRNDGLFTESLATALTQTSADAAAGLRAFLEKRDAEFGSKDR